MLYVLVAGIVPLVILSTVGMAVTENTIIETRTKNVSAQFSMLSNLFTDTGSDSVTKDNVFSTLADEIASVFLSRVQVINQDFTIISDSYQINKGKLCISREVNQCFEGTNQSYTDREHQCIVLTQAIRDQNSGVITHVLFATASISDIFSAMDAIRLVLITIIIIMIIVLIAFAVYAGLELSRPFRNIEETIEHIGEGGFVENMEEIKGGSELRSISNSFNTMLRRINQLEASRQEFVSNVSHELKTPMTSMKVLAESLIGQQGMPEELYQEFLGDIVNELDRENNIISDLLTLVKLDSTSMELNISQVNINEMIEAQLKLARPLAKEKNIELVFESFTPIIAEVDETKFSMCISNLVVNAIKYNNADGWVHVSINADRTYFYVKVQDNGFGIPEEAQEHIFDRFFRVDKARDRATGGTGLGLAITKSIVMAHNGTIRVFSQVDKGSTFTMQIPLTYLEKQQ